MVYVIKCDTYDPDSTKLCNTLFSSFEIVLKTLCILFFITVMYFWSSISFVKFCTYLASGLNALNSISTYISVITVIVYRLLINWIQNWFVFFCIAFIFFWIILYKLYKSYNAASFFMRWCIVRNIWYWCPHSKCLWIGRDFYSYALVNVSTNITPYEKNIFCLLGT